MAINLYDTHTMLEAVRMMKPKSTFLRDRYFPTSESDIFESTKVLVDFEDEEGNKLAPAVLPNKGGIPVARGGYETEEFTPPLIAPERVLTIDQIETRLPGENIVSSMSPQQREASIIGRDLTYLTDVIDRREEWMAAQTLLNNGYTLRQYANEYGSDNYVEKTIQFYEGAANPATYTPGAGDWTKTSDSIISDLSAMANILLKRGIAASDVIVSGDVADVMLANDHILKLLDNRRFMLTQEVSPAEQANGSTLIAVLNVKGHMMNVYAYTREYEDDITGKTEAYIPSGYVIVTAPGMGRTAYGAVTQIDQGNLVHTTYAARRVPQVITNPHDGTRALIMRSRPLTMPKVRNAAVVAKVF